MRFEMFNYIIKGNNYGFNDFYIMKNGSLNQTFFFFLEICLWHIIYLF